MLFFPFRADIKLSRFPLITICISIICLIIYWNQVQSDRALFDYAESYCSAQKEYKHRAIMRMLAQAHEYRGDNICSSIFVTLNYMDEQDKFINEMVAKTTSLNAHGFEYSHENISQYITKKLNEFEAGAPASLSNELSYKPDSYNPIKMVSSAFAHGSWSHVIGNLFFFFAFAATIESILGKLLFPALVIVLAIGTNLVYSISVLVSGEAIATLGLSGVVYGVMGLFIYFLPHARIRCFFWFLIIIRRFGLPAWLLAGWYMGWDVYGLYLHGNEGGVNLVAHVSGFIEGYLIGVLFLAWRKKQVEKELRRSSAT